MTAKYLGKTVRAAFFCIVALSLTATAFGQGKGGGGGRGSGGGAGHSGGPPPGVGVDRGLGNASRKSNGRSDDGLENASNRSNGRSDQGLNRARMASDNLRRANEELRAHPGLANKLHLNANDLRDGYKSALSTNPDLKFGQYVSATRLAQNLGTRFPNVTRAAILNGLASGDSLGRTLQNLGLSSQQASDAKKRAEREIKQAKQ
ncbi:MAG TPA: hypothetical protein VFP47_17250 [Pyrinomonadaceae bacterium]|nr:hypothetical protein [Pyrinomonadaceae bacterium]